MSLSETECLPPGSEGKLCPAESPCTLRHVITQLGYGLVDVIGTQRIENASVLSGELALLRIERLQPGQTEQSLNPESFEHPTEVRIRSGLYQFLVKGKVESAGKLPVSVGYGVRQLVYNLFELIQGLGLGVGRQQADRSRLTSEAGDIEINNVPFVELGDKGPTVGNAGDNPLLNETLDRLAQRAAAHVELLGEILFGKLGSRLVYTTRNRITETTGDQRDCCLGVDWGKTGMLLSRQAHVSNGKRTGQQPPSLLLMFSGCCKRDLGTPRFQAA